MKKQALKHRTVAFRPSPTLRERLEKELEYPIYNGKMSSVVCYILAKGIAAIDSEFQKDKWQADVKQSLGVK